MTTTSTPTMTSHQALARSALLASLGCTTRGRRAARRRALPYDPVLPYLDELVPNPHVLVVGQPGSGKSVTVKCLLNRLLGSTPGGSRHVGIVDPRGEYGPLAEVLGLNVIRLYPTGPDRLNPLDAGPDVPGRDREDVIEARMALVVALSEMNLRRRLSLVERWALECVISELDVSWGGPQPVIADVAHLLAYPTTSMTELGEAAPMFESLGIDRPVDVIVGGRHVHNALADLLGDELRGTFDGASTVASDGGGPGAVVDLLAFHARGPAAAFAAVAGCAWLETKASCAEEPGDFPRRYNVLDEAHLVMSDEHATRYVEGWLRRSAAASVANVVIGHGFDDLRWAGTDEALFARAASFADGFGTSVVFRQSIGHRDVTASALGLCADEADAVLRLGRGRALWKVAGAPFVVQHDIEPGESPLLADPVLAL